MSASKPTPMRRRRRASKAKLVTAAPAAEALAVDPEDGEEEADDLPTAAALEVDIPPAEPEQTSFLDRAKSALGFGPEKDVEPKPRAGTGRLNKHQQQLYDMAAPLATEIGISLGAFAWEKAAGSDYRVLAPSDEVAAKIMQPLTRIAARHIQLHGKASPDALDLSASLFAMVGYMWSSVRLYQEFKKEEQHHARQEEASPSPVQQRGDYAGRGQYVKRQAQHAVASDAPVSRPYVEDVPAPAENGRYPGDPGGADTRNLTPAERANFNALNRLRMQDYESRRRKSGIA